MQTPYQHILVPLDGSDLAEAALRDAISMAQLNNGRLTLLEVVSPLDHMMMETAAISAADYINHQKTYAENYLAQVYQAYETDSVPMETAVTIGKPGEAIIDYAKKHDIDLIVMATHGRSGVARWMYGSVADKVLRGAEQPVLLVRNRPNGVN